MDDEEFIVLSRFLADNATGVEGRASQQLTATEEQALIELAGGRLEGAARTKLLPTLQDNAVAVAFLAEQIRLQRAAPARERERAPVLPSDS